MYNIQRSINQDETNGRAAYQSHVRCRAYSGHQFNIARGIHFTIIIIKQDQKVSQMIIFIVFKFSGHC